MPTNAVAQRRLLTAAQDLSHASIRLAEQDSDAETGDQVNRFSLTDFEERRTGRVLWRVDRLETAGRRKRFQLYVKDPFTRSACAEWKVPGPSVMPSAPCRSQSMQSALGQLSN